MNKKKTGIILSSLAATTLALFLTVNMTMMPENQSHKDYSLAAPDYPLLSVIPKTPIDNEQDVFIKIGHNIKFPAYLPSGYKIQLSNVDEGTHAAIILASQESFTEKTTRDEFIVQQKGVDIYMEPLGPNFNADTWKSLWIKQNDGKTMTINGFDGVMYDTRQFTRFDETFVQPATLILLKDGMMVVITSTLPSEELIKIAKSL